MSGVLPKVTPAAEAALTPSTQEAEQQAGGKTQGVLLKKQIQSQEEQQYKQSPQV